MRITLLQTDIQWARPADNRQAAEALMITAAPTDVFILPEMFSTGFATEPEGVAETADSDTLRWMQRMADRFDAAVCGSVAVAEAGRYFNRCYFVKPGGTVVAYDKHHLFSYGGENRRFTAGEQPCRVEWRGATFRLCVCYDLRFPVWSRNSAEAPYDVLLYVANWPETRRRAWDALLRARAIENQCYVAAVNRVGTDPCCRYDGGSCVTDAYGNVVCQATDGQAGAVTAELDLEALHRFRQKFPVLADADAFRLLGVPDKPSSIR
ncbi:MAG: amidohydrolase [Bacteroidaceae bacterium]|nr:amidohydrolase [Bacteroidaceae bacterium]